MKKRLFSLIGVVALAGAVTALVPRAGNGGLDEAWLIAHTPKEMEGYRFLESPTTPGVSYVMDKTTYDKLKPMGISARVFEDKTDKIDTVVIAGNSPDNFHDPTWCLPGQGWEVGERKETTLRSGKLGDIRLSYFEAKQAGRSMIVAYTFRSPSGYTDSITKLTLDMWKKQFFSGKQPVGAFYRFLTLEGTPSLDRLSGFVVKFLERSRETSTGIL